jgi:signal transduction histidine kinase
MLFRNGSEHPLDSMNNSISGGLSEASEMSERFSEAKSSFSPALKVVATAMLAVAGILALVSVLFSAQWLVWLVIALLIVALALVLAAWRADRVKERQATLALEQVHHTLDVQSRRLEAFHEIAAAVEQSLDLREVLELGLEKVLQVTGQEAAEIHLLDANERTMTTKASIGQPEGFRMREEVIVLGECLCGLAVLNGEPLVVPDIQSDARVTRLSCLRFGYQSAACVPLRVKGRAIGVLTVHGREKHHFGAEDTELLGAVANQLATAIENARLYAEMEARVEALSQKLQYMAVVEERERLGREMHDGLAQTLSLLSMQVSQARSWVSSGDIDSVMTELLEMSRVIDAGYEEVREAITSLRLAAPKGKAWIDWLQEYVADFGVRHDLSAELQISDGQTPLILPPHQEVHLTRIIQEALNNVRRHAGARQVHMALIPNGRKLTLRIEDDGRGFDVKRAQRRRGSYGLSSMQERAELLGGSLQVQSAPGQGTRITVEIERDGTAKD